MQQLMKSIDSQSVDDDLNIANLSEVCNDVSNVRKWLDVERDEEVCEAMQSDFHQELMSGSMVDEGLAAIAQEVESSRVNQEEEVKAAKLPSLPKDVCDSALAHLQSAEALLKPYSSVHSADYFSFVKNASRKIAYTAMDQRASKPLRQMHIRDGLRMMADRATSSNAQREEDEEVEILR